MKTFEWDPEKSLTLKKDRGISFEDALFYLEKGNILAIVAHPNADKYTEQKIFIIEINSYAYLVPFIETEDAIFLKTIIPSRKATKIYLEKINEDKAR